MQVRSLRSRPVSIGRTIIELSALFAMGLAALLPSLSEGASKDIRPSSTPDGICYPVSGTGYMVSAADGTRIPVGALSPLIEGDSLIVMTGTITFVDFRTGESAVYGEGSRLRIAHVPDPKRPSWLKRLEDQIVRGLSEPERDRVGGSVRGVEPMFWPDSVRFAPGVPIVFEWRGARPSPALLRIVAESGTEDIALPETSGPHGAYRWIPPQPISPGPIEWALIDAEGELLGTGAIFVLSGDEADAARARYRSAADSLGVDSPRDVSAAILAEADRFRLW